MASFWAKKAKPPGAIEGDHPVLDQDPNNSGIQSGYDSLNNLKTDYGVEVERQDILHGGLGNNLIRDYTNTDYLSGGVGDDYFSGVMGMIFWVGMKPCPMLSHGDDVLDAGVGNDIKAGAENDVFYQEAA